MSDNSRIPRNINDFNSFITTTNTYLLAGAPTTNAVRLGVTPTELAAWSGFVSQWVPLYVKYLDKRNSRTPAITDGLWSIIDKCVDLDHTNHILDRIAASPNMLIADLEVFNIRKGQLYKSPRSTLSTAITEPVLSTIMPIGGGSVNIKCHSSASVRACIYEDANSVQYVYTTGTEAPTSANDRSLIKEISTRAGFTLATGAENTGQFLFIYFRWYHTSHPTLAGPWSQLQKILLI